MGSLSFHYFSVPWVIQIVLQHSDWLHRRMWRHYWARDYHSRHIWRSRGVVLVFTAPNCVILRDNRFLRVGNKAGWMPIRWICLMTVCRWWADAHAHCKNKGFMSNCFEWVCCTLLNQKVMWYQYRIQECDDVYAHFRDNEQHCVPCTKLVCWCWFEGGAGWGGLVLGQYFNGKILIWF